MRIRQIHWRLLIKIAKSFKKLSHNVFKVCLCGLALARRRGRDAIERFLHEREVFLWRVGVRRVGDSAGGVVRDRAPFVRFLYFVAVVHTRE